MRSWHPKTVIVKPNPFAEYGSGDAAHSTTQSPIKLSYGESLAVLKQLSAALAVILLSLPI